MAEIRPLDAYELRRMIELGEPVTVLDVRSFEDYRNSDAEIAGALRLPPDQVLGRLAEIPRGRQVVTYSADGRDRLGDEIAQALMRKGFTEVRPIKGGFEAYLLAGGPIAPRSQQR